MRRKTEWERGRFDGGWGWDRGEEAMVRGLIVDMIVEEMCAVDEDIVILFFFC